MCNFFFFNSGPIFYTKPFFKIKKQNKQTQYFREVQLIGIGGSNKKKSREKTENPNFVYSGEFEKLLTTQFPTYSAISIQSTFLYTKALIGKRSVLLLNIPFGILPFSRVYSIIEQVRVDWKINIMYAFSIGILW